MIQFSSSHNDGRAISVVYEVIMKIRAFSSPFWFTIDEDYLPRPLIAQTISSHSVS